MSLSEDPVFSLLKTKLVCGWRDISDESYCGVSGAHGRANPAARTTNGAGPHNTQIFLLSADGTVLHCLPGFWDAHDLAFEIGFAQELDRVWRDGLLTRAQKDARFREMHLSHVAKHPQDMVDRSPMQGFDKKFESRRRSATSDCILRADSVQPKLRPKGLRNRDEFKSTDQIVHERMAARPFLAYASFDVAKFSDYGRPRYDKKRLDGCDEDMGHDVARRDAPRSRVLKP